MQRNQWFSVKNSWGWQGTTPCEGVPAVNPAPGGGRRAARHGAGEVTWAS